MRDEEYHADQVAAYGTNEQPAVAARMRPHLRMTQVSVLLAALGSVCAVVALVVFPRFRSEASGVGWAVFALLCCLAMLAICVLQLTAWRQAMAWWRGERTAGPAAVTPVSWWAHVVSYPLAIATLFACMAGSAAAGWSANAAALLALALLFALAAQVLGGVQYVRPSGPPGTIPTHMRRILARERARQQAAAAIVARDSPDVPGPPPS